MSSRKSIEELRAHRSQVTKERERADLHNLHGARLVSALSLAVDDALLLADFHADATPPYMLDWPARIEDAPGLVASYISKPNAYEIVLCIESVLGDLGGLIGFHDKDYLGLCQVSRVKFDGFVAAAERANEAVVFYPELTGGVIVVDCYADGTGMPFSVLAQGTGLIDKLRRCFDDRKTPGS